MSEREWFIIDTRTDEIINCVTTNEGRDTAERVAANMVDGEHLRVDCHPLISQLQQYRYWNERL